jgi:hypothetical protein
MHLDSSALDIEEGLMAERIQVEIAAEFAIDARQQIEVEPVPEVCARRRCIRRQTRGEAPVSEAFRYSAAKPELEHRL